jgi:hypothetical protein
MEIRSVETFAKLLAAAETAHKAFEAQLNLTTDGPCTTCDPWPVWYAKWLFHSSDAFALRWELALLKPTTKYDTMSMEYALSNFAPEPSIASQRQNVLAGAHPWPYPGGCE